ncbi:MAG: PAS domain S-box protein, partial [Candidatus Brocadiaceae bacterium]|nr:PAS domain S-box protein [Candidatus Brocadiaceae bacterium]
NVVLAYDLLPDSDKYSHEINVAGRQRMLSQKISKLAFSIAPGSDVQREPLLRLVELFNKSHLSLLEGGVSVPWNGEIKTPPPDVKVALERVSEEWPEFNKSAVAVAGNATDNPVFKEALDHIRRNSDRLLGISDQITRRFAENLRHKVLELKWALAIMFCVDVVIFFIGYFLGTRIVRPIRDLLTATAEVGRGELKRTVQVVTHDEIGELGIAFNKMTDDLKRSRDELVAAKEFANSILESMIDPLFVLDLDGIITKLNSAAINLLGCTEEELTGEFFNEIIDKGEYSDDLDLIREVVVKGDVGYYKTKDGNTIPVNLHTSVMKDEKGKYCGYACVGRDMRQIKGLINELEISNRELENFAYIASHDLKEPLRGIHNYSSFLVKDYTDKLGEDGKSKLFTMIFLCRRLDNLIDDLLYFSRVGRVKDSMQYTDLNQIVDKVLGTLKIRTEEEGVEIRFKRDMPGIVCDRIRMKDIFLN